MCEATPGVLALEGKVRFDIDLETLREERE
jgi:hypothetical protein